MDEDYDTKRGYVGQISERCTSVAGEAMIDEVMSWDWSAQLHIFDWRDILPGRIQSLIEELKTQFGSLSQ